MIHEQEYAENIMSLSPGKGRGKARGTTLVCKMPCPFCPVSGGTCLSPYLRANGRIPCAAGNPRGSLTVPARRSLRAGHSPGEARSRWLPVSCGVCPPTLLVVASHHYSCQYMPFSICHDRLSGNRRNVAASGRVSWQAHPSFRPPKPSFGWWAFQLCARATSLAADPTG
jgi:hypothetical protein